MRIRSAIAASLASGAIVLVGWQAGTASMTMAAGTTVKTTALPTHPAQPTGTPTPTTTTSTAATPAAPATPVAVAAPPSAKNGTFAGSAVQTPYGTVQVQAVISGGKITDVVPLSLTDVGSTSTEIDNQAVPILKSEVLASQTAKVSAASGATYTSQGYLTSLQAALDAANFTA